MHRRGRCKGIPGGYPKYVWNYDENHARIKEIRTLANGDVRTLWYLNPDNAGGLSFESETNSPASPSASDPALTSNRHYLTVDGAVVGVLVSTGSLPSVGTSDMAPPSLSSVTLNKVEYWHLDYQNSLTVTTDQAGTVTERYAYDPFGKRRYTNGTYDAAGNLVIDWSDTTSGGSGRGYKAGEKAAEEAAEEVGGKAAKGVGTAFKDFNQARNAAVKWLEDRGFKAEQATLGKFGDNAGKPVGMKTADGRVGFRVEYDARSGAHINVFAGKEKGPHFTFEGNQSMVNTIVKQFEKRAK